MPLSRQFRSTRAAPFFVDLHGAQPDAGFVRLDEVFHLEDQLALITQQE